VGEHAVGTLRPPRGAQPGAQVTMEHQGRGSAPMDLDTL
jgi:hypothetical protein